MPSVRRLNVTLRLEQEQTWSGSSRRRYFTLEQIAGSKPTGTWHRPAAAAYLTQFAAGASASTGRLHRGRRTSGRSNLNAATTTDLAHCWHAWSPRAGTLVAGSVAERMVRVRTDYHSRHTCGGHAGGGDGNQPRSSVMGHDGIGGRSFGARQRPVLFIPAR